MGENENRGTSELVIEAIRSHMIRALTEAKATAMWWRQGQEQRRKSGQFGVADTANCLPKPIFLLQQNTISGYFRWAHVYPEP